MVSSIYLRNFELKKSIILILISDKNGRIYPIILYAQITIKSRKRDELNGEV